MKRHILIGFLAAPLLHAAEPQFVPIFNGTNLDGWTGEGYVVEDGTIVCTPAGKNLATVRRYANYILDFEFKLPPGGNNGLGIHYSGAGNPANSGMEIQILDNDAPQYADLKPGQFHGSLYLLAPARREGLKPVGEWNRQRVTVAGPRVMVELNGITILDANLDELGKKFPEHAGVKRRAGHLALCGHRDPVAFRALQIAELPPECDAEAARAGGFMPLLDGSLEAWKLDAKLEPHWMLHNGILRHDGKTGDLWTKQSFKDFELVFDWRWPAPGPPMQRPIILPDGSQKRGADGKVVTVEVEELDSGVYLRGNPRSQVNLWNWPVGSGEVWGYRTADPGSDPELLKVRAAVTPKENADRPLGEWNRMKITLTGEQLGVLLNGRKVIDQARLPGVPPQGPVALQHHNAPIDFANLWIKEL